MVKKLQAILFFLVGLHLLSACGSTGSSEPSAVSEAPTATSSQGIDSTDATSSQDSGAPVSWMINFVPGLLL